MRTEREEKSPRHSPIAAPPESSNRPATAPPESSYSPATVQSVHSRGRLEESAGRNSCFEKKTKTQFANTRIGALPPSVNFRGRVTYADARALGILHQATSMALAQPNTDSRDYQKIIESVNLSTPLLFRCYTYGFYPEKTKEKIMGLTNRLSR